MRAIWLLLVAALLGLGVPFGARVLADHAGDSVATCTSDGGTVVSVGSAERFDTGVWVCNEDGKFVQISWGKG